MKDPQNTTSAAIRKIKEWAAPTLFMAVSFLIWRDISELRTDVKTLLAQANGDKIKIEKVESDVNFLRSYIFNSNKKVISQTMPIDGTDVDKPDYSVYVLKKDDTYDNLISKIKKNEI